VKLRVFVFGFALTFCLYGQKNNKGFNFVEACFRNPALPYCIQRDFVAKPPKGGAPGVVYSASPGTAGSTIDAAGIDWRFADPAADSVAVLNGNTLSATPFAHSVIDMLASSQGLSPAEAQKTFLALSGLSQVALSVHDDKILMMVTGRAPDSVLPAPEAGWKALPLAGNTVLIGHAAAVDQAALRLTTPSELGELPGMAQSRPGDSEFWAAGSAKLAGQGAVSAGVNRFEVTASMRDRLSSDTVFEFDQAPEPAAMQAWLSTLADAKIEGNGVRVRMSMDADEARRNSSLIALSPLGQRLRAIIQSARHLPVRDTDTTVHSHPVIFGLDGGPREVK
jgi:hypothetical protein